MPTWLRTAPPTPTRLSKRTDLNAVLTHFDNKDLAQAAPGQAGFLGGLTTSAGTDSNSLALGIRIASEAVVHVVLRAAFGRLFFGA